MGIYLSKPNLTKFTQHGSVGALTFGVSSMQGWRKVYEDSWTAIPEFADGIAFFAVFDGHGGPEISKFCAKYFPQELKANPNFVAANYQTALEETFLRMDTLLMSEEGQIKLNEFTKGRSTGLATGCTAVVALVTPTDILVANAGDSKAMLYTRGGQIIPLTQDHVPSVKAERVRIKKAGGWISEGRVNDNLNLTRAIGDLQYKHNTALSLKEQVLIAFPDVSTVKREGGEMLVLGVDGFWEKCTAREIFERLDAALKRGEGRSEEIVATISALLDGFVAKDTMEGTGCDNITCALIKLADG